MNKLQKQAKAAVASWCKKTKLPMKQIRHVHPRAYVVGKAAHQCLIVAAPWQDSEPQCQEQNQKFPLWVLHEFEAGLDAGMWCAMAYVVSERGSWNVAVKMGGRDE